MQVYYKFGLLIIFLLSISIIQTAAEENGLKAISNYNSNGDYVYDDDDYMDDVQSNEASDNIQPEIAANRQLEITSSTTTTTFRPIFSIPRRSSHVLEPSCPRSCRCMEDFKYVKCADAHLTHVPLDLPKMAAIVDLSNNVIAELRAEDFANLSKLVEINLNSNLIRKLDKEAFVGMERLSRLYLANNQLTKIDPDTFAGATDLTVLDLSNNSIAQRTDGSLLNQPNLNEFFCSNCNWTELPDQIFSNMSALKVVRLDQNDFNRQINTRAFTPLKKIIKLKLSELEQENTEELCRLLSSIDKISFKHFELSCFELVLGKTFNESIIQTTDLPLKRVTGLPSTLKPTTTALPRTAANRNRNRVANETGSVVKAGVMTETSGEKTPGKDEPYQVPISKEVINILLICIMGVAVLGIIVGLICRKDVGGIKTKCCRTNKPEPKDQVHPTEEIPLNKLA